MTARLSERRGLGAAVAGIALLMVACGSSTSPSGSSGTSSSGAAATLDTNNPFRVLSILSESGATGGAGLGDHQGLQYTADQINQKGGILGRQVVVDYFDDTGDAVTGLSLLNRALASKHYDFIDAGSTSQVNLGLRPAIAKAGTLAMSVAGGAKIDVTGIPTFFTVSPGNTAVPDATMMYLANDLKPAKVALLTTTDAAGQVSHSTYTQGLAKTSIKIVADVTVASTAVDVTSQLNQARAANPDVLVASGFGAIAGHIAAGLTQLGWNIPVVGDLLIAASNLPSLVDPSTLKQWSYVYYSGFVRQKGGQPAPALDAYFKALTAQFGTLKAAINQYTAQWDMLWLVKWAAEKTKGADGKTMSSALESFSSDPAAAKSLPLLTFPTYAFSATNHTPVDQTTIPGTTHPFFQVGAASSQVIDGTVEQVATISLQPTFIGI